MPRRTRGVKALKENVTVSSKKKNVVVKSNRKPLADKTNSASDNNNSGLIYIKENTNVAQRTPESVKERSRRNRRLPTRYEENNILKNLSNFSPITPSSPKNASSHSQQKTTSKTSATKLTPHKTPSRISSSPLISKRPKRICRLPSKLDAQSVSPTNNTSIEPSHASTPIPNKSKKKINEVKSVKSQTKSSNNKQSKTETTCTSDTKRTHTGATTSAINKVRSPATNNVSVEAKNTKQANIKKKCERNETKPTLARSLRPKVAKNNLEANIEDIILKSVATTNNKSDCYKNPRNNVSFRLLEDRKNSLKRDSSKLDVYEFTFDPSEEPPPQKKKKKRNPRNPSKPKKVVKSTYDKTLEKALASLKQNVALKKRAQAKVEEDKTSKKATSKSDESVRKLIPNTSNTHTENDVSKASENRYNSIRIEDIAMQFQDNTQHESVELNYSPVDTPMHAMSPVYETDGVVENAPPIDHSIDHQAHNKTPEGQIGNKDPLNLQDHISFFDEEPVASSSMNLSTRHPTASPWRVEFNNLPIKWKVNSYVKPNMTPAIERSFIDYNDSQKKHVYTNIIAEPNESLPQIEDNPEPQTSNLRQTSIISFIKEVAEKNANKKKKPLILTNSLFEDTHAAEVTHRRNKIIPDVIVEKSNTSGEDVQTDNSGHKDSSCDSEKVTTEKQSKKDKDITYFGFDESENQENVSPVKTKTKKKKTKTRKALQAINGDLNKPKDIPMPIAAMSKPARLPNQLDKVFDDAKAATEPPVFPEQHVDKDAEVTNINTDTVQSNINNEDSNSVHLFEDIELIHHVKPTRKSYGKPKKVTFQQSSTVNNFNSDNENNGSSDEDDLEDLSFKLPSMKEKKPTKKKTTKKHKLSKKEEKEAEEWAAGFNSMCEDIDEFDLVVE